ncbi:hypothetical protein LMCDFJHI_01359 [Aeromonas salmonicida]
MNGGGVGGTARYQSTGDHDDHVTLQTHAAFQRCFFTDAIEIVGRGDAVNHVSHHTLGQNQLGCSFLVGGDGQDPGLREVLANGLGRFAAFGGNHDQRGAQLLGGLDRAFTNGFGDAQLVAVVGSRQVGRHNGIGTLADGGHDGHGFQRVLALGGLTGQHDCIGTVQDGVGHVAGFGAGRTRVLDHGIQHLGGGDHHFACLVALGDDHLLGEDHFFNRNFHAHVATCHHDAVGDSQDLVEVVQAFLVFDLGDDLDVLATVGSQVLTDFQHVFFLANEGSRNEINALLTTEDEVALVFLGQGRQLDGDTRQVDAFVLAQITAVQHFTDDFTLGDFDHIHADQAVIHQDAIADAQVVGETGIGHGHFVFVANDGLVGGEGEGLASDQGNVVAAFQLDGTDFRTLGVEQYGCVLAGFGHDSAQVVDTTTVLGVIAVGEVQAHDVHAGIQHFSQHFFGFGLGTYGADDFGLFHVSLHG